MEIKTKIRYLVILTLPYENNIATNYKVSYQKSSQIWIKLKTMFTSRCTAMLRICYKI